MGWHNSYLLMFITSYQSDSKKAVYNISKTESDNLLILFDMYTIENNTKIIHLLTLIFVNIWLFWSWFHQQVSDKLGRGPQKTVKVVECSKTPVWNIPQVNSWLGINENPQSWHGRGNICHALKHSCIKNITTWAQMQCKWLDFVFIYVLHKIFTSQCPI